MGSNNKIGDRVVLTKKYLSFSAGSTGTVVGTDGAVVGTDDRLVTVQFDNWKGAEVQVFSWRLEPEVMDDSVDALIVRYARDLRRAVADGTLAAPYSEIGIFASFLRDYRNL